MKKYFARYKLIKIVTLVVLSVVLLDVAFGTYVYSDARQWCTNHLMYNIPGRGRLTNNPYSTEEIRLIRLDCHASGLEQQAETVRLPFNKSRIARRLAEVRAECATIPDYQFGWGCQLSSDESG